MVGVKEQIDPCLPLSERFRKPDLIFRELSMQFYPTFVHTHCEQKATEDWNALRWGDLLWPVANNFLLFTVYSSIATSYHRSIFLWQRGCG